jgi:hypothetical protein
VVDDRHRSRDDPHVGRAEPLPREPDHGRVRRPAELQLVGVLAGERGQARRPGADQERHALSRRGVGEARPRLEPEDLAVEAGAVAGEQAGDDLPRLGDRRQRPALLDPEPAEPRARREAEEGAASRDEIERSGLAGELDRVDGERVEAGGAEARAFRRPGDLEQRGERGLVPEVVERGDDVESAALGDLRERRVLAGPLVGLQAEPELAPLGGHVSSAVGSRVRPTRSTRMITRSSGSGQAKSESCSSQSPSARARCFAARNGSTDWSA